MFSATSSTDGANPNRGSSSGDKLALDNLIRRELKVGDPNNPQQVAQALLERYSGDPRARAIVQEAAGLPFLQAGSAAPIAAAAPTATGFDLQQAMNDVDMDLQELTTNNLVKDIIPELQGWAQGIRSSIEEGVNAARMSLDPRQRDKAFSLRRQLGDYARMARLVGALTPAAVDDYRNLAQSLDEVGSVLLVMMGEAIANSGIAGGRYLLQAPFSELQTRRDAAIYALRNLIGATQQAYGPNQWPRGIDAYRRLFDVLEAQGQTDLRTLLSETELARIMDELVRRAAQGSADGLRALGATAQLDLARFNRLIALAHRMVVPESPPLSAFLEALQLFTDAFNPAGGCRLLRIARPPILFYGLYSNADEQFADQRLLQLLIRRGLLASQLDCLMRCNCSEEIVLCQIVLDKVLYDVDRAIDYYAVGDQEFGQPEARASACSYLIDAAMNLPLGIDPGAPRLLCGSDSAIAPTLTSLRSLLRPIAGATESMFWEPTPPYTQAQWFENLRATNQILDDGTLGVRALMHGELCIQNEADERWRNMVETMAPNCIRSSRIFGENGCLQWLVRVAVNAIEARSPTSPLDCRIRTPDIPADFETSLSAMAFNHGPGGSGRWA